MGDNFYIAFLYEDEGVALDESDLLKAIYLELKAGNVEEMRQEIVGFGVKVLDVPDPLWRRGLQYSSRSPVTGSTRSS